jgi:hypothetical protein
MRFGVSLRDRMFGEKIDVQLADGTTRKVTKRWSEEMHRQGKVTAVGGRAHRVGRGDAGRGEWGRKGRRSRTRRSMSRKLAAQPHFGVRFLAILPRLTNRACGK